MRVVGYARLSRAGDGHGLQVQREAIIAECERRGWDMIGIEEDTASGRSTRKRPGLQRAIEACSRRSPDRAQAIVSSRVDRLARSSLDLARIIETARRHDFDLICTEQSFKLDSPEGRMLATVLGAFAAFESDLISARSRDALAIVKAQGSRSGRPIGNPGFTSAQPETVSRILDLRSKGLGLSEIARRLDREGIPTAQGGRHWRAGVIQKILKREEALSAS